MKQLLLSLLFLIFVSCQFSSKETPGKLNKQAKDTILNKKQKISDSLKLDTITLNNQKLIQLQESDRFYALLSLQGDTIVKPHIDNAYFSIKFLDIDEDGHQDIRVFTFGNTPNECENYLYNKVNSTYHFIENCDLAITKVKGSDFYYSYNRAGCSDLNWESHLYRIENYKLVTYGYIYGQGCDYDIVKYPQVIEIFKVDKSDINHKKQIEKLAYKSYIKKFEEKWDFIEKYWKKNYSKFDD